MIDYNKVKDNPDIEMGTTFEFENYVCEVDDFNDDNPNESIVFIYPSQEDYKNGNYIEQVSLLNKGIKSNIEEYMALNYGVFAKSITKLEMLLEIKQQLYSNLLTYSTDYLMSNPKRDYRYEWHREQEKISMLDRMIREEKQKNKEEKNSKDKEER